jgi:hypothetical protein
MTFRIRGLDAGQFEHLFALDDAALAPYGGSPTGRTPAASALPTRRRVMS